MGTFSDNEMFKTFKFLLLTLSVNSAAISEDIERQVAQLNSRSDSNALLIQQMVQLYLQIQGVDGSIGG